MFSGSNNNFFKFQKENIIISKSVPFSIFNNNIDLNNKNFNRKVSLKDESKYNLNDYYFLKQISTTKNKKSSKKFSMLLSKFI